jgi:hypothetical protein
MVWGFGAIAKVLSSFLTSSTTVASIKGSTILGHYASSGAIAKSKVRQSSERWAVLILCLNSGQEEAKP